MLDSEEDPRKLGSNELKCHRTDAFGFDYWHSTYLQAPVHMLLELPLDYFESDGNQIGS